MAHDAEDESLANGWRDALYRGSKLFNHSSWPSVSNIKGVTARIRRDDGRSRQFRTERAIFELIEVNEGLEVARAALRAPEKKCWCGRMKLHETSEGCLEVYNRCYWHQVQIEHLQVARWVKEWKRCVRKEIEHRKAERAVYLQKVKRAEHRERLARLRNGATFLDDTFWADLRRMHSLATAVSKVSNQRLLVRRLPRDRPEGQN